MRFLQRSWDILSQHLPKASLPLLFLLTTPQLQAIHDTNQNGVSDLWEKKFNSGALYLTFNPTADPDADGWTNAQEAAAGTDPSTGVGLTGHVRTTIVHTPAVYFTPAQPGGAPQLVTPEVMTITWPTVAGKKYTLLFSTDLTAGNWTAIGDPRIGEGTEIGTSIPLTQPDGTTPAALFWRVTIVDIDTDSDTLTNAEEAQLGSNPSSADGDGDGLSDVDELFVHHTNSNSQDSDNDGVSDDIEIRDKTNPNSSSTHGPVIKSVKRGLLMYFYDSPQTPFGAVGTVRSWENSSSPDTQITAPIAFTALGAKLEAEAPFPETIPEGTQFERWPIAYGYASKQSNGPPPAFIFYAHVYQRRMWLQVAPAAAETIHRSFMKVTERSNYTTTLEYGDPNRFKISIERVDVTIPKGKTESSPFDLLGEPNGTGGVSYELNVNDTPMYLTAESVRQDFLAVEAAPEVLAVNSDFDEGRIDPTTGHAIPDCDDIPDVDLETGAGNTSLELGAVRNHLDGTFTQGQLVVDDLHLGWFGVNPMDTYMTNRKLWVDANVTIRKVDKVDDATGYKESGQVRFYAKWNGGYYGITPYDFKTLEPVNLVSAGVNGRPGEGVYGASSTIPYAAKFYMEGVRPGKITLEWRYKKGDIDVKYEQSFEVCTQKNASEWKAELAYKIRLETSNDPSGQINVLSPNLPTESYRMRMERISEYYDYYQDCFLSSSYTNPAMPQTMSWPGLARLAGSQVVGGLSDAEYGRQFLEVGSVMSVVLPEPITNKFLTWSLSETKALQQALFSGARTIFNSIGWQMHAYRSSGYRALDWVESETGDPELRALTGVWKNQCIGVLSRNRTKLDKASENITDREQNVTIVPTWTIISGLGFGLVDNMFSVLGRNSCTPAGRNFSDLFPQIPVSTGSLANTVNRWTWIKPTTPNGILDTWNKQPTASRDTLVRRTLEQDARRFSLISHFPDPSPIPLGPLATIPLPVWVWDNKDVP